MIFKCKQTVKRDYKINAISAGKGKVKVKCHLPYPGNKICCCICCFPPVLNPYKIPIECDQDL